MGNRWLSQLRVPAVLECGNCSLHVTVVGALSETVATFSLSALQCLDCPSSPGSAVVCECGSKHSGEGGPCHQLD